MSQRRPSISKCSDMRDTDGTESEKAKLQDLQRRVRTMERENEAHNRKTQRQTHKQEQEIGKLLKEREELSEKLRVCKRRTQTKTADVQRLQKLLQQNEALDEEIEREKQKQKDLQKKISNMESELIEIRRGAVSLGDKQRLEVQRTQKAVEGELHRATTKLNKQLAKNNHLKEKLQSLLTERQHFHQQHNKLNKELQELHKKICEVTNQISAANDERAESQSKLTVLRETAEKERAHFNTEMRELERVISQQSSLKDFMSVKGCERSDHKMGTRQLSELKEQNRTDSQDVSLDVLEDMFKKLLTVTGEEELDLLVTRFIQGEEENFALFNLVNEQNKEIEALKDEISQIRTKMEQVGVKDLQLEQDYRTLVKDIQEQLKVTECQAEEYEDQANIINKILDQIKTGVNSTFSNLECDCSLIEDMVGSSTGITDNNIMSYLGLVEQKTDELLTIQAFLRSKDPEKESNPEDLDTVQQNISTQPAANSECDAEESPVTDEDNSTKE